MEELKMAYAQVILTTTKEAAARVMAAELRARRLESQLASTTDEATRMLVRLKRMLDEEVERSRSSSFVLQQKIDELECQLNEAEGIVVDLREELHQVQKKLSEEKKKRQLPIVHNEYKEPHNAETNGNNPNRGLYTPSLDALPEFVVGNGKTLESNEGDDGHCQDPDGRASTLLQGEEEDAGSGIRRSQRKRKLKVWDDVVSTFGGLRCKKPKLTFPSISSCTNTMLKQCIGSDNQPQSEAEDEIEEDVNNLQESKELIDSNELEKQEEVAAATAELETDGCGESTTPSKFNQARRKLFQYAVGRKWRNLSTIYPENVSSKKESDSSGSGDS